MTATTTRRPAPAVGARVLYVRDDRPQRTGVVTAVGWPIPDGSRWVTVRFDGDLHVEVINGEWLTLEPTP